MEFSTSKLKQALALGLFMLCFQVGLDAQRVVSGRVLDIETGEALIGATVVEKGVPTNGVIVDIDGNFKLKVAENAEALVVTYSSYETTEVSIVGTDNVEVKLSPVTLEEVVIIGYGTVKKEDATGSVQKADQASFNRGAITGPQELISGKIAGVVVTPTDGSPGGGGTIRVRGLSSLNATQDPLIVVDGVPLDNASVSGSSNPLNFINPMDIESFTVLKDASAAAIYGNRASGGVILITTKKGKLGRPFSVGYSGNVSWGVASNTVDVLGAEEYRRVFSELHEENFPGRLNLLGDASTDWQDEIYRTAFGTDHNVNFSGAAGLLPYRVSLGYTLKEGILDTDEFQRYSGSLNLNPGFFDNTLQLNFNLKASQTENQFADRGAIGSALTWDPTQSVRPDSMGAPFGGYTTWVQNNGLPNVLAPANPVALLDLRDDRSTVNQYVTNLTADYRLPFFPQLRANLNVGYERAEGEGTVMVPTFASFAFDTLNGGGVNNRYNQTRENTVLETYANYREHFGIHGIDVMAGYSWQHFEYDNFALNSDVAGTPSESDTINDISEYFLVSLFGRINYDINDKYLFTFSVRQDHTSRFAKDFRAGLFPAAAVAVKAFEDDSKYFNYLKVRASWGVTGQQSIGGFYDFLPRYQRSLNNARYQFGDEFINTLRPNGYVSNLQWEETTSYNLGADFNIIRDRISATVDVYQRNTDNLFSFVPFAALSNLTNELNTNIGSMESQGVEVTLNFTPVRTQNIFWTINTNMAYNRSEITKLRNNTDTTFTGQRVGGIAGGVGSTIQIHSVGHQPNSFWVYEQLYDEDGQLLEGEYADRNGDGEVNDQDFYRFNAPYPLWTFGITNNFQIGNFNLAFAGRANLGQYVYNNVQTDMGFLDRTYQPTQYIQNVHRSAVDLNVFQQANLTFSDHFVTRADFFRMDHITVGYDLTSLFNKTPDTELTGMDGTFQPAQVGSGFLKGLSVYATVQNAFVITGYDGLDPEVFSGIDGNVYPRPRTYLFGINANF
jgi:TonB-linked SusC/RagA family outer membrane protein